MASKPLNLETLWADFDVAQRKPELAEHWFYENAHRVLAELERAREACSIVELTGLLLINEGASVSFVCDNPDFNGRPDCVVYVFDGWNGAEMPFSGDSIRECLEAALYERSRIDALEYLKVSRG